MKESPPRAFPLDEEGKPEAGPLPFFLAQELGHPLEGPVGRKEDEEAAMGHLSHFQGEAGRFPLKRIAGLQRPHQVRRNRKEALGGEVEGRRHHGLLHLGLSAFFLQKLGFETQTSSEVLEPGPSREGG